MAFDPSLLRRDANAALKQYFWLQLSAELVCQDDSPHILAFADKVHLTCLAGDTKHQKGYNHPGVVNCTNVLGCSTERHLVVSFPHPQDSISPAPHTLSFSLLSHFDEMVCTC